MKILLLLSTLFISLSSYSYEVEHYAGGGLNVNTFQSDLPGHYDLKDSVDFAPTAAYKAILLWGNVGFRTGVFLEWKDVNLENELAPAGEQNIDLTSYYAVLPLTLQFNINDNWALFGGLAPRLLVAKRCENCGRFDENSNYFTNYVTAGITYEMTKQFSTDLIFSYAQNENYDDLKINTASAIFYYQF